ncbi:MAG: hypothetical protein AAFP03_04635 [Cyanobacteria bacterium J06598_3]
MIITVITLNSLIALGVCWLAYGLWQWRQGLIVVNSWLQSKDATARNTPQEIGYALTLRRVQLTQLRLGLAQWQLRSRQLRQLLGLLKLLRTLLIYRAGQRRLW